MYVCPSSIRRCRGFGKLSVNVWFHDPNFCLVIHCSRRAFYEVPECSVSVSQQSFCKNQPALRLRENTTVFLGIRIENMHQCTVKIMMPIRRFEQLCTIWRIQNVCNRLHCCVCLLLAGKSRNHTPALRIQPHICFWVFLRSNNHTIFPNATDEAIFVPAGFQRLCKLCLCIFQIIHINSIVSFCCQLLHHGHCIIKLESNEG